MNDKVRNASRTEQEWMVLIQNVVPVVFEIKIGANSMTSQSVPFIQK